MVELNDYKVGDYVDNIYFVRKPFDSNSIISAGMAFNPESNYRGERVRIDKIIVLADKDFREFESDFYIDRPELEYIGGHDGIEKYTHAVLVRHINGDENYYVNTEGYNYARYVGVKQEVFVGEEYVVIERSK